MTMHLGSVEDPTMSTTDRRIDRYIDKAAPFARPILAHLRRIVRAASPEIDETIKWGAPFFTYKGGPLCYMAAFKAHCSFGFWRGTLLEAGDTKAREAMGSFGRITRASDLPSAARLTSMIRAAMKLKEAGVKAPNKHAKKSTLRMPAYFAAGLRDNARARAAFEAFSPSQRREYVEWLAEAKTDATREKRLATAIDWIGAGKPRNWKYMPKAAAAAKRKSARTRAAAS
jgi:uncharacterized protein YdeI (YjbR/CyaY-like superfamily)